MPRINPRSLINCLDSLLNEQGGILGSHEVTRMIGLMEKFSNTLVSKVCYTLILSQTEPTLLTEFLSAGGWKLLFQWLGDAILNGNNPFIKEILQLLIKCPVRIVFLRESNAPRIVKGLSKDSEDPVVRDLAKKVVEMWLDYIKSNPSEPDAADPEPEPASPPAAPESPPPMKENPTEKKSPMVPPFKLILRDGKHFLLQVGPEKVPTKIRKIQKENESDTTNLASQVERIIVRDADNKLDVMKFRPKKSNSEVKISRESEKLKSEKKDSSRSPKSVKSSQSKSKEKVSETRTIKVRDYTRVKGKLPSKSKESEVRSSSSSSKSKETVKNVADVGEETGIRPTPAISSLGKIPKKTATSTSISAAEATATGGVLGGGAKEPAPLPVIKKGTFSDERKRNADIKPSDRPKTVKTLPTKFRSTGLEEEVKPPSRKKDPVKDVVKRPVPASLKEPAAPPPPEKKPKVVEIKEKMEKPGIKLIPAKPKPILLESDMFSDALTASSSKEPRKKKSRRSSSSSSSTKDSDGKKESEDSSRRRKSRSPPKASSSPVADAKPPKFYRDTLDEPEPKKEVKEEEEDSESSEPPRAKVYPEGILIVSRSKRSAKKSIRWRSEADLVTVKYFDLDENERVNVSRCNFMDLKTMERSRERENLLLHKQGADSDKDEKPWGPLFLIEIPPDKQPPERGAKSLEKEIQLARQKTVLEAIFFSKSMIPDSPAEPDPENHPMTDPSPIPLQDTNTKEFDFSNKPWPEGKTEKLDANAQPVTAVNSAFPSVGFSYPGFPGAPGPESWRNPENGKEGPAAATTAGVGFPPNGINIPPPFAGMRPPYGPPPNGMIGPDGFNMPMFPPNGFPMPFGPVPPMGMMGPAGWGRGGGGWNGPRPPLPLETQNICKSWSRSGKCYRGNMCRYLHPGSNCPPLS